MFIKPTIKSLRSDNGVNDWEFSVVEIVFNCVWGLDIF